jgi:hypothetical protein
LYWTRKTGSEDFDGFIGPIVTYSPVKELNLANKNLKKKFKANLSNKYSHDEKMMQAQLCREWYVRESKKEKREGKHASVNKLLENKNKTAMLVYNLRKQTKEEEILCHKLGKKRKDTKKS